jgi:hypothetical protein
MGRFVKGQVGNPKGRTPGSKNKTTQSMREAFLLAFDRLGGAEGLVEWGTNNRTEFYKICSKLIPVEVTGKDGADLVQTVKVLIVDGSEK